MSDKYYCFSENSKKKIDRITKTLNVKEKDAIAYGILLLEMYIDTKLYGGRMLIEENGNYKDVQLIKKMKA